MTSSPAPELPLEGMVMSFLNSNIPKASTPSLEGNGIVSFLDSSILKTCTPSLEGNSDAFSRLQHSKGLCSFLGGK